MNYFISALIGYLLGSIPTAYLFLKRKKGLDITQTGSGNMGAMNTYEITNSKFSGIFVFIIDFVKGIAAVLIFKLIYPDVFILPALSLVFAIFSHCYNPWIKFKGGRGLATAAGGTLIIFPFLLLVWGILWSIIYLMKKDILLANIFATILSLLLVFNVSDIAIKYTYPTPAFISELIFFTVSGLMIIFIKHIDPLLELIETFKKKGIRNDKS